MDSRELESRLERIRERMARAAERAGRRADEIVLVAVTKTFPPETVELAWRAGLRDFGENRVQEALAKIPAVRAEGARWHLVGHLQTNKARDAASLFHMIHSMDSERLAAELDRHAARLGRRLAVLIEVKTTAEPAKLGVQPDDAPRLMAEVARHPHLELRGLMTVGPLADDPEAARPAFRRLALLARDLAPYLPYLPPGSGGAILSMGMTDDFEVAIEEGSTMIRVGRALFGERLPPPG